MIRALVDYSLKNKFLILVVGALLLGWGFLSFHNLPVEAYPDVANNYVQVITQWPGRAAEEVEQQVTIPVEIVMSGIQDLGNIRSISEFGLSVITMNFTDHSKDEWNRERVLERLSQVTLPTGLQPQIGPDYSPVGQLYWYTLVSYNPRYDLMSLKSLQDWVIYKQLKSVQDVVDVSTFGGLTKEYQVQLNPDELVDYGIGLPQVEQALTNSNVNAGGSFIQNGQQQINVREVGLVQHNQDVRRVALKAQNGTPIYVSDIGKVDQAPKIRLGQIGKATHKPNGAIVDNPDTVEGIVLLRKGANGDQMLRALHEKVAFLNSHFLPPGVKIVPFLDRSDLVQLTTDTVLHNLTEGMLLVSIILFLFLGNVRSALIVVLTIPFALLFASICLDLANVPANLLSLGALDFGMVVDGSVVVVENVMRHLSRREERTFFNTIREAVQEVQRPLFFSISIIIIAYLPIFTLQHVEGRLFHPMADTVACALIGALFFALSIVPALAVTLLTKNAKEWHNPVMTALMRGYRSALMWATASNLRRMLIVATAAFLLVGSVGLMASGAIGSEFLPHLDEGAIWARGTLAPSTGPAAGEELMRQARLKFASFPEVTQVVTQVGRPDDGTDVALFSNTEYFIDLKPKDQWRPVFHKDKEELINAMDREVEKFPGVLWNFSQPISDNVEEAVSGVKGQLAVKIFGTDLKLLEAKGDEIVRVMQGIPGIQDLGLFRVIGQPNLNIAVDREKADRWGVQVSDVQDAIQTAVGGNPVSQVLQGEERYDLVLRYQPQFRDTSRAIGNIRILSQSGERVSLAQVADIRVARRRVSDLSGKRFPLCCDKYSVRGRDLGSTVEEAISTG